MKQNATYTISANNNYSAPSIAFSYDKVEDRGLKVLVDTLRHGFSSVQVVKNDTGEVICSYYEDWDFFCPTLSATEAIDSAMRYIEFLAES